MDLRHSDGSASAVNKEVAAMRSAGAGLLGALLMVAPLVAIPILAVVGVPQFAPAVATSPVDSEDSHLDADLDAVLDPDLDHPVQPRASSPRSSRRETRTPARSARSHLNQHSAGNGAADLFGDYPGDELDAATSQEALEFQPREATESADRLDSGNYELDSDPVPDRSRALASRTDASRTDASRTGASRPGHRPLPEPRSGRLDSEGDRMASTESAPRVWTNQTPGAALAGWEEDLEPVPANRSRASIRLAQSEAVVDTVDVMADLGTDRPPSSRPASRQAATSPPATRRPASARQPARAAPPPNSPIRSIPDETPASATRPGEELEAKLDSAIEMAEFTGAESSATAVDLADRTVAELEDRGGEMSRDRLQRKFNDPLGQAAPAASPRRKSAPARQPVRNELPVADLEPSDSDFAQATPLVEHSDRTGAARSRVPEEGFSTEDPEERDAAAGRGSLEKEPGRSQAAAADDLVVDDPEAELGQLTWKQANARLKGWGIRKHNVDYNGETGRFTFRCLAPDPNFAQVSQRFEAEGDDPLSAVNAAIVQISDWYRQRARRRTE
jgi:hypothetical protein